MGRSWKLIDHTEGYVMPIVQNAMDNYAINHQRQVHVVSKVIMKKEIVFFSSISNTHSI